MSPANLISPTNRRLMLRRAVATGHDSRGSHWRRQRDRTRQRVALARIGFDVGITWHGEEKRAQEAVREIEALGRRCALCRLDLERPYHEPVGRGIRWLQREASRA